MDTSNPEPFEYFTTSQRSSRSIRVMVHSRQYYLLKGAALSCSTLSIIPSLESN